MRITECSNTIAWELLGRNSRFPDLFECGHTHYYRPYPGMLVTSYAGQKHLDRTGKMGLGMVVAVRWAEKPHGACKFRVTVLWNFSADVDDTVDVNK